MHGEVDGASQQRLLDFLGEQPFASGFGQRPVLNHVAGRADHLDLDLLGGKAASGGQAPQHFARLDQRQRRAA